MIETVLGIDLNGVYDSWACAKTSESPLCRCGRGMAPSVVIAPRSRGEKPLAGKSAIESITGKGWSWPDDAGGPDENGFSRRIPIFKLLELINEGKREIEYAKESFFSVSELIAGHLSSLNVRKATSSVIAIPDHADESFQQRIVDARYDAGFDELRLIWRPVATLLNWGARLSEDHLREKHGSNALVVYLGPFGFEASIMKLEVEDSKLGSLLTPVRSSAGKGSMNKHFNINSLAENLSGHWSSLANDDKLAWQMLWGTPFIWRKLLGLKSFMTVFQKSDGQFIELLAPEIQIQHSLFEKILDGLANLLDEFDPTLLARVKHVITSGHFFHLCSEKGLNLGDYIRIMIQARVRVKASFHNVVDSNYTGEDPVAIGAAIYAWRLANGLPTYYDFLPQLEINALSDGKPDFIPLIPKQAKIRGGESYRHDVTQPFSIPAESPHLEFFIHKEGDQVRKTVTKLKEPPKRETPVRLVVKQTPGQGHANVEIHADKPGIFGPRTLTLDWDSLEPTYKDKTDILKKLVAEARFSYPDHAPVFTHESLWSNWSTLEAFEEYLDIQIDNPSIPRAYWNITDKLYKALAYKRRDSYLIPESDGNAVFSLVDSDGRTPNATVSFGGFFRRFKFPGSDQELVNRMLEKVSEEFCLLKDYRYQIKNHPQKLQRLFLIATWCYSACPSNVVEYLLDQLEGNPTKSGVQVEAASRSVFHDAHIKRFFNAAEKHCDASVLNQKWAKAITQVFQFREHSPKLLSETQALKFTLMALGIIVGETEQNNFQKKFLWGVLLLMLLFRYRIKNEDFLKWDRPQYESIHRIIKHILSQIINKVGRVNERRQNQLKETISMLDYKGTNQLIAREVASEIAGSESEPDTKKTEKLAPTESIKPKDYDGNISQALGELEQIIGHQSYRIKASAKPIPELISKSPKYEREPKTFKYPDSKHELPKQGESTIKNLFGYKKNSDWTSSETLPWAIPSATFMEIPLLKMIYQNAPEKDLRRAPLEIGKLFNIPETAFKSSDWRLYNQLNRNIKDAADSLLKEKQIELTIDSRWTITDLGLARLRKAGAI